MADRLVVMDRGVVQQVGTPRELYEHPANAFVAGFIGKSTFFRGRLEAPGRFRTEGGLALSCAGGSVAPAAAGLLAVRPERIALLPPGQADGAENALAGKVGFVTYLGALTETRVALSDGSEALVVMPTPPAESAAARFAPGDAVTLAFPAAAATPLPPEETPR